MHYGVVFPQIEIGADPVGCRDFAQAAEGLGFDGLMTYDHVLGGDTLDSRPGWSGCVSGTTDHVPRALMVLFAHVAAADRDASSFVTGILILPQRQTALVAKQAAEVDVLSGGRMTLGIGVGWNDVEFEVLGQNFRDRGRRSEEQIEVMRRLWTQESVDFDGKWHRVPAAGINPLPVQRPIPVWIGGEADAVLRRAARIGEGWLPMGKPGNNAPSLERLRGHLAAEGREGEPYAIVPVVDLHGQGWDDLARDVEDWRALGATHLYFDGMKVGITGPAEHIAAIERFRALL